ncbi:MAG: prolipoprotein diacylglyceryl transferase [Bacteroidales bacterium]|jgi:prolipoprotein diacylglyceryltransferase|nr:prolipoprotein diacylglyceryl transferase [Bacteroidales bacterium]
MYPRISDFINDVFGTSYEWPIMSYGFFLTLAFLLSALVVRSELKRKENEGLIVAKQESKKQDGINRFEFFLNLLLGFVLAFKIVFILLNYSLFESDPQAVLLSGQGSWPAGILGAIALGWINWKQQKSISAKTEIRSIRPHQHTATIVMIAAISGVIGAKIFHQLENWDTFVQDPIGELFSFAGLTFYGGLITAAFFVAWYGEKQGISWRHLGDAVAPALILAYGIGRIGCQIAGDGDWGIVNNASMPDWLTFLPQWIWAYDYPNNVLGEGIRMAGCEGPYCFRLADPVFPTPIYETSMSLIIFGGLLLLRKVIHIPGQLFAVYLVFNGIERGLIEQIRVNNLMNFLGMEITQAQLISSILILLGVTLFFCFRFFPLKVKHQK